MNNLFNCVKNSKFRFFITLNILYFVVYFLLFLMDLKYFEVHHIGSEIDRFLVTYPTFILSIILTIPISIIVKKLFYLLPLIFYFTTKIAITLMLYLTIYLDYNIFKTTNFFIATTSIDPTHFMIIFLFSFFIEVTFRKNYCPAKNLAKNFKQ